MRAAIFVLFIFITFTGCGRRVAPEPAIPAAARPVLLPPPLPDSTGWGVPVLTIASSSDGALYVGTHGRGVFAYRLGDSLWRRVDLPIQASAAVTGLAVSGDLLWYGTAGDGWGAVRPGAASAPAPMPASSGYGGWRWVALNGVATAAGRVAIGTAAGVRITEDGGASWRCVVARGEGVAPSAGCDAVVPALASSHVLSVHGDTAGLIWVGHLAGVAMSADGGRSWREPDSASALPRVRIRGIATHGDRVWLATESHLYEGSARTMRFGPAPTQVFGYASGALPGSIRALIAAPNGLWPAVATSQGLFAPSPDGRPLYRHYRSTSRGGGDVWGALWWARPYSPFAATASGLDSYLRAHPMRAPLRTPVCGRPAVQQGEAAGAAARECTGPADAALAEVPRHTLLQRPIRGTDGNPYENPLRPPAAEGALVFHSPAGSAVRAIADGVIESLAGGVVLRADPAVRGSAVVITYAGVDPTVTAGQRVRAGEVLARVAPVVDAPAALRLSVELIALTAAGADTLRVNPSLVLRPVDGTGILAMRVRDATGEPVAGVRLHGIAMEQPTESPYGGVNSYDGRLHPHPAYGEHLALGGVPPGLFLIAAETPAGVAWRHVRIVAGQVTFAELVVPAESVAADGRY
jgi:hypothetical protein